MSDNLDSFGELKSQYLKLLWETGSIIIREEPFTLKSGKLSYIYINHRDFICHPSYMNLVIKLFTKLLTDNPLYKVALCNVNSLTSPILLGALARELALPIYLYRESNFERGIEGHLFTMSNLKNINRKNNILHAILIDDVITTLNTINNTLFTLNKYNINVNGVLCLIDRRSKNLKTISSNSNILSVLTLNDIIEYLINRDDITDKQKQLISWEKIA